MINKKLGFLFIFLGLVTGFVLFYISSELRTEGEILGCYENIGCSNIEASLTLTHFAFGVVGFLLSLGIYLLFFYTGEQDILKALKKQKDEEVKSKEFDIILSVLDDYERQVLQYVKDQDGIGQRTLVIKTGLSKSKISDVIKSLEGKKLVKKVKKAKNNYIHYLRAN